MSKRVPLDRLRAISRSRPLSSAADGRQEQSLAAEWPIEAETKKAER
jgi:hypothetical protein